MINESKTLLIVEDNPGDVYLIENILNRYRPGVFHILSTDRLDKALALLEKETVDVVLLDMNLPDSLGMETVHAVKQKAPDVALVVVTGDDDEKLGIEAVKHGAQDFLVKGKAPGTVMIRVIHYALERQASEKRLKDSELFLRSTLDALSSHIAIIDREGQILAVNKAWRDFARDNHADMTRVIEGSNYFTACAQVHGDDTLDAQSFLDGAASVLKGETKRFTMEYPCHSLSEKRWFHCRITPFPNTGPPCVVVSHENISQRKLAQEELINSRLQLKTILDSLTLQIVFIGLDHRIIWANQALCDFAGLSREELLGKTCYDFWEGQTGRCDGCAVEQAINDGRPVMKTKKTADGKIWMVTVCPVKDQNGRVVSMVEAREDITEKASIEEQLHQSQKMDAIGRLAGGVAHDFNNMLSIIIGFAELSRGCLDNGNPLSDNIGEIISAARRSSELTRHLLAFARKQPVTPKVLDLNLIMENSQKMLQRLVGEDITMRFDPDMSLWNIFMDPIQIDQILTNLAANARDAIAGTGSITIETRNAYLDEAYCRLHVYATPGHYVLIQFSDTGKGMDEATRSRVFEPFFTTKPVGEGTGLGLSTVFGIIKQNKGSINVYSETGCGTTFRIYIPRHEKDSADDDSLILESCPRGTESILVVEDEKKILKLCHHLLKNLGYKVLLFSSPLKALRYMAKSTRPIDLMLSDVIMPDMNGDDLKRQMEIIRPGLKTLFMSGYAPGVISDRGILKKPFEFVQKPFTIVELATRIRALLDT